MTRPPGPGALIKKFRLKPHPEGGWYRETYRAALRVAAPQGRRSACTAVLFLLKEGETSRLHRLRSDELWHFYAGGPLRVVSISPAGKARSVRIGPDAAPQHLVPAGSWFGAAPERGAGFSLVCCTVAPGFDFRDFELGGREALLKKFPRSAGTIRRFTNKG